jgi:oligoribonuclease
MQLYPSLTAPRLSSFHALIRVPEDEPFDPAAYDMHRKSGLLDLVRTKGLPHDEVHRSVVAWLERFAPKENSLVLTGNTIRFDRAFLKAQFPQVEERFLHYRMIDVSSFKEVARSLGLGECPKLALHRSMEDIDEARKELRWCLQALRRYDMDLPE